MANYSSNYLKVTSKTYSPHHSNMKSVAKGSLMFKEDYKRRLIQELGDSEYLLLEYFHSRKSYNFFVPTDDTAIAKDIGWTASKVKRIKTDLVKAEYLLILKDTAKDGAKFYRIILGKELVEHYHTSGMLPDDADITVLGSS